MPPLDGARWEPHLAQTVGLEVPIANGNGSIMLYHVDEDLNAGLAYSRIFGGIPLRPSLRSDLTTAGTMSEVRIRKSLSHIVHPRLGIEASSGISKRWNTTQPLKVLFSLELVLFGIGRLVAAFSGGEISVRSQFGDSGKG
mmetsp:Transcript_17142/g.27395  ORF Transcript_17142/g.27395 Transcript_17142/m.27395 type:complete len:141 (+) Transcript_17142:964-1386(+)